MGVGSTVDLTPAGRSALYELRQAADALEAEMLKDLTHAERRSLQRILSKLFTSVTGA